MKSGVFKFSVRDITEIAIMCALAIVLDKFVKIQIGGEGGSINIATVPLFIIAFRQGWFKGLIATAIIFGLTTNLLDGYGINTYPFEYFIAFGSIAISGLFGRYIFKFYNKNISGKAISIALVLLAVAIHFTIRMLFATFDSMLFYEVDFIGGWVYNISYVGPSCLASFVVICVLLPVMKAINSQYPTALIKDIVRDSVDELDGNEEEIDNTNDNE